MVEGLDVTAAHADQNAAEWPHLSPAISSAASTARVMERAVSSMLITTPPFRPAQGLAGRAHDLRGLRVRVEFGDDGDHLAAADVKPRDDVRFWHSVPCPQFSV
jgi:hypothetical protein